jgi:hypothetical protein
VNQKALEHSSALWNRTALDLNSDEVVAQILDRGELAAWRELYRIGKNDPAFRTRLHRLVLTVPLPLPRFWLAALATLGEPVELGAELPDYYDRTSV